MSTTMLWFVFWWLLVSIVSGVVIGICLRRLATAGGRAPVRSRRFPEAGAAVAVEALDASVVSGRR